MSDDRLGLEGVVELSPDEGREMFDWVARDKFGMSGSDWLAAYDEGRLEHLDHCAVQEMAMLIPFVRNVPGGSR